MARQAARYVCQQCGSIHPRWVGRCESCGAWNSIAEEAAAAPIPGGLGKKKTSGKTRSIEFLPLSGQEPAPPRRQSGIAEFDRVCGGGLVPGSALLVGGDPGIGKSTLLLQVTAKLAQKPATRCVYISGEEAIDQIRMRASRLGLDQAPVQLATATDLRSILGALDQDTDDTAPTLAIIDSIQTLYAEGLESAPGTVGQVRACSGELIRLAKRKGFTLVLVGHVTKDGMIAGPKVLEHMVDTVLYFEGERGHQFRILRTVKNRFGPTDEIGVFEMTDAGLAEVSNPSALFLAERQGNLAGSAVFAGIEGTRPVLVEIQALVAPSSLGTPRRAAVGWDSSRLAMVIAVLEARGGLSFAGHDIYLNVAGGLRVAEPAADLAAAAALISALLGHPVPQETVTFGEIGLSGEVRPVGQFEARTKEALKLGFSRAFSPRQRLRSKPTQGTVGSLEHRDIAHIQDLISLLRDEIPSPSKRTTTRGNS